jgi:hypothetical protein
MKKYLCLILLSFLFSCASNSIFQDAIPVTSEKNILSFGASMRGVLIDSSKKIRLKYTDISILPIDIGLTSEIDNKIDFSFKYTIPLTIELGLKFCMDTFSVNRHYYSALGFAMGFDLLHASDTNKVKIDFPGYFSFRIPVYQTLSINKYCTISIIPNSMIRLDYRHFQVLAGSNLNTKIGSDAGVLIEGSYLYNFRYREPKCQFGANAYFPIKRVHISG